MSVGDYLAQDPDTDDYAPQQRARGMSRIIREERREDVETREQPSTFFDSYIVPVGSREPSMLLPREPLRKKGQIMADRDLYIGSRSRMQNRQTWRQAAGSPFTVETTEEVWGIAPADDSATITVYVYTEHE